MKARLEVLRAVEESEAFMGDKLAERDSNMRIRSLRFEEIGQNGLFSRQKGAGVSTSNSPRTRRIAGVPNPSKSDTNTRIHPQPPPKSQRRRHWHLFNPDPALKKERKKRLQERRKRNQWRKMKQLEKSGQRHGTQRHMHHANEHQQPPLILGSVEGNTSEDFTW